MSECLCVAIKDWESLAPGNVTHRGEVPDDLMQAALLCNSFVITTANEDLVPLCDCW